MFCLASFFALLHATDPSIGRIDKSSLSQQTLLELLVGRFTDARAFYENNGSFKDISIWSRVTFLNDSIIEVDWSHDHFDWAQNPCEPGGSIDLQWIPETVTSFNISDLELVGSVNTAVLPRGLIVLCLGKNRFRGTFAIEDLPQALTRLELQNNTLSGSLAVDSLPLHLETFRASNNSFSGILSLTRLPATLKTLDLCKNSFEGSINLQTLPNATRFIKLYGNQLKQDEIRIPRSSDGTAYLSLGNGSFSRVVDEHGHRRTSEVMNDEYVVFQF